MNREHLLAFVWLRYRLRVNQLRKAGVANAVVMAIGAAGAAVSAVSVALGGFLLGLFALADAPPATVMLACDGAVAVFLFAWLIGLMADLQRSEAVSVERVLHLPVSPAGAFLVNYVSSLASFTLALFLPGFVGLALGLAGSRGALVLLTLPLLAAFLFAVTALTYQFQGWLAAMMSNPRRRRTIVVSLTLGLVVVSQLPQLANLAWMRGQGEKRTDASAAYEAESAEAKAELDAESAAAGVANREATAAADVLGPAEREARFAQISAEYKARLERNGERFKARLDQVSENHRQRLGIGGAGQFRAQWERIGEQAWLPNALLPPGWLPLGAAGLTDGNPLPALLGTLGLAAIGAGSLWRAYRTTMRMYTGTDTGGEARPAAVTVAPTGPRRLLMAEWRLPWVGEPAAAVAAAGLRSLTRAPEAKMMFLGPVIFGVMFGSMAASMPGAMPEVVRPLLAAGGVGLVLLTAVHLVGNQFGYDRGGFRAYVLAPVPRRDVLFGKNLAAAPLVLGLGWLVVLAVGVVLPMRFDHLLAAFCQAASMYLLFCALANALSILAPLPMAAGAMQPTGVRFVEVLGQLLLVMLLPVALAPTFLPLGVEVLLTEAADWGRGWPIALALSALLLAAVAGLYWWALAWEGRLLASREQEVLRVVTSKEE